MRVFLIEVLHVFAVARVRQFAVQLERPGVIRAGDDVFRPAVARQQLVAAVWADVVKGAQYFVAAAHHQNAFTDDLAGDVVVRLGELAAVRHADPTGGEHLLFLVLERCLVGIEPGRNGVSLAGVGAEIFR